MLIRRGFLLGASLSLAGFAHAQVTGGAATATAFVFTPAIIKFAPIVQRTLGLMTN